MSPRHCPADRVVVVVDDVDLTHEAPAGHFSCCASELPPPPLHAASTTSNANPATNRVTSAWWHSSPGSSARNAAGLRRSSARVALQHVAAPVARHQDEAAVRDD